MFDNLFSCVGDKIKKLAKISFLVEVVAAILIIIGGVIVEIAKSFESDSYVVHIQWPVVIGLLVGVIIIALILSWFVYGFGELIENSESASYNLEIIAKHLQKTEKGADKSNPVNDQLNTNEKSDKKEIVNGNISADGFIDITCPECDELLSFPHEYVKNNDSLLFK